MTDSDLYPDALALVDRLREALAAGRDRAGATDEDCLAALADVLAGEIPASRARATMSADLRDVLDPARGTTTPAEIAVAIAAVVELVASCAVAGAEAQVDDVWAARAARLLGGRL